MSSGWQDWGYTAAQILLESGWQSLVLAGGVWLLLRWWQSPNAATRYALWCVAFAGIVVLPVLGGAGAAMVPKEMARRVGVSVQGETKWGNGVVSLESPPVIASTRQPVAEEDRWSMPLSQGAWAIWILPAWGGGALLLLLRLGRSWRYARRLKCECRPLPRSYRVQLRAWGRRSGVRRSVLLGSSRHIAAPLAVGLWRPAVLLPVGMVGALARDDVAQVGLHELAHLKRYDDWSRLFQELVRAVWWPLPAVWWIGRKMDLEREIACDDWVVAHTGRRRDYARCLTRLLEMRMWGRDRALAVGAAAGKSQIAQRVGLLLDRARVPNPRLSPRRFGAGAVVLGAGLLALGACANPFAPPKHIPDGGSQVVISPATQPEILFDNLHQAMRGRDLALYESLIDEDFWFTEFDCRGDLVLANGREKELEILGNRQGTSRGVFDAFREFRFDFSLIRRDRELGPEYPYAFAGDPDGHPHEDWEVYRGRVQMLMLDDVGDGYRIDQVMTFKLREDAEGLWKIVRWDDDPIAGECAGGELALAN